MNFDLAVQIVLMKEGGLSNHPTDPGGTSKYGISKRAFPNENIATLSLERAKILYKKHYWDMCYCDSLPDWLRLIVFDCSVNQGVSRAIIFLQRILKTPADGIIGPKTLGALAMVTPKDFLAEFTKRRFDAYKSNPQWSEFGKGWMERLLDISLFSMISVKDEIQTRTLV